MRFVFDMENQAHTVKCSCESENVNREKGRLKQKREREKARERHNGKRKDGTRREQTNTFTYLFTICEILFPLFMPLYERTTNQPFTFIFVFIPAIF